MSKKFFTFAALIMISTLTIAQEINSGVLVLPNRYTLLQLGFDLTSIRPIRLVSYDFNPKTGITKLFVWNPVSSAWDRIKPEEFIDGIAPKDAPLLFVKDLAGIPPFLEKNPLWTTNAKTLDTPDLAGIVNMFDSFYKLTPGEWKWIASRYNLKTKDLNEERRRYGRYGKKEQRAAPVKEPQKFIPIPIPETDIAVEEISKTQKLMEPDKFIDSNKNSGDLSDISERPAIPADK